VNGKDKGAKSRRHGSSPSSNSIILAQCPMYFAYSVRALSVSSVPLMMARPSGKTVKFVVRSGFLQLELQQKNLFETHLAGNAELLREVVESSAGRRRGAKTWTALRPHRAGRLRPMLAFEPFETFAACNKGSCARRASGRS